MSALGAVLHFFLLPPDNPPRGIYEISLSLSAPSSAMGKMNAAPQIKEVGVAMELARREILVNAVLIAPAESFPSCEECA